MKRLMLLAALAALAGCAGSEEYQKALEEGIFLSGKENYAAARERLERAVDLEPDESAPRFHLARTQIRLGRFADAENNLRYIVDEIGLDAVENFKDRLAVFVDLGSLELRKALDKNDTGGFFKAQNFFEEALRRDENFYQAILGKALCMFGLERYYEAGGGESAHSFLSRCVRREPAKPEPLYFLAQCNERDKRLSTLKAFELYEKVLALFGDPAALEPASVSASRVFNVPVVSLDRNYALLALERIVPLMASLSPADLGLDGIEAREKARDYFGLYNRLGGKTPLPQTVVDWMEGGAATSPSPTPGGSGTNPGGTAPPAAGNRPELNVIEPAQSVVHTGQTPLVVRVAVWDDAPGFSLKIELGGEPLSPAFRDLKIEEIDVQGRKGERRSLSFEVPLEQGENVLSLRVIDREGLASDPVEIRADYRAPSVFAVVAGFDGSGEHALHHAESDAADFLREFGDAYKVPPNNRLLLTGADASAETFRSAIRDVVEKAWEADAIVVYFAGYGASVEGRRGLERFLVFDGFDPAKPSENGFPLSRVGPLLEGAKARSITLVLDAGFGPKAGDGARTFPDLEGPDRAWDGSVENIFQIPSSLSKRIVIILADGAGTAVELSPKNPNWRKGGVLTSFLIRSIQESRSAGDPPRTRHCAALLAYLGAQVSYAAARLGERQDVLIHGDHDRRWVGK